MSDGLPTATLRIEYRMTNPPQPIGLVVSVDGKPIAVCPMSELKAVLDITRADERDRCAKIAASYELGGDCEYGMGNDDAARHIAEEIRRER